MPNYLKNEIVLVRYPFSDLTNSKVRPAVVVNSAHVSKDLFIVALTSKTQSLMAGEFVLSEWQSVGLNIATAVKRGVFTIHEKLVLKTVGKLAATDAQNLDKSLREWFDLQ
ncbi:MAG: type II toxin-antitoxin system PemK/MazF family toxin [Pyrinomonadaceae bacterium]